MVEFINEQEAQNLLNVKRTTLWKLRQDGVIDYAKIGRKTLYHLPSIHNFILSHSTIEDSKTPK